MDSAEQIENILSNMASYKMFTIRLSKWQIVLSLILSTYNIFATWSLFIHYFTWDSQYICNIPANATKVDAIPMLANGEFSKCEVYETFNKSLTNKTIPCPIGYNHTIYPAKTTFGASFGLYCENEKYGELSESLVFGGIVVGSFICAVIGDSIGKRLVMIVFLWIGAISGICTAFSPYYWMFGICRFLSGVCHQGYAMTAYVLSIELYATRDRGIVVLLGLLWPIGMLLLALLSFAFPNWRYLYLATSIPMLLTLIYPRIIPESLYWLAEQKRDTDINRLLTSAYKINNTSSYNRILYSLDNLNESHKTLTNSTKNRLILKIKSIKEYSVQIFKRKTFIFVLLIASMFLTMVGFLYNGLTLAAGTFSSNRIVDWVITSLLEIPIILLIGPLVNRYGRKNPTSIGFFTITAVFILISVIKAKLALQILNHLAKFAVSGTYTVIWLFTPEMFPTSHRNFGIGFSISLSKIASAFSAHIPLALKNDRLIFSVCLAVFSSFCAIITQFLWEPLGRSLPETIEDMPKLKFEIKNNHVKKNRTNTET